MLLCLNDLLIALGFDTSCVVFVFETFNKLPEDVVGAIFEEDVVGAISTEDVVEAKLSGISIKLSFNQ